MLKFVRGCELAYKPLPLSLHVTQPGLFGNHLYTLHRLSIIYDTCADGIRSLQKCRQPHREHVRKRVKLGLFWDGADGSKMLICRSV